MLIISFFPPLPIDQKQIVQRSELSIRNEIKE